MSENTGWSCIFQDGYVLEIEWLQYQESMVLRDTTNPLVVLPRLTPLCSGVSTDVHLLEVFGKSDLFVFCSCPGCPKRPSVGRFGEMEP
jgi:hypothetical protein